MPKRLALLIGNVRYQDSRLASPISGKTLSALADVLEDAAVGQFDEVFIQLNKPAVEVQLALAEFMEESTDPADFLFIYFAGHALYHQEKSYLAAWDTFTEGYLDATAIQPDYVKRRLSMAAATHKFLLLDCFAGVLFPDDNDLPEDAGWLGRAFAHPDFVVATAVRPFDPQSPANQSAFTTSLPLVLQQAQTDGDQDGFVTALEWFQAAAACAPDHQCQLYNEEAADQQVIANAAAQPEIAPPVSPLPPAAGTIRKPGRRRWLLGAAVLLLLFLAGGWLFSSGVFDNLTTGTEANDTPAVAIIEPTETTQPPTPTQPGEPTTAPTPTTTATQSATATTSATVAVLRPTQTVTSTRVLTSTRAAASTTTATSTPPPVTSTPSGLSGPNRVEVARQLIFMRSGPAINFRILEYLARGTALQILGQTSNSTWFNIALEDGRTGWVFGDMLQPEVAEITADIPVVDNIPQPENDFYDFGVSVTGSGLTAAVGHVYVGSHGPEAQLSAELVPPTNLINTEYQTGTDLGLGRFVINFSRAAEGAYTSTAVRLCMVSTTGEEFYCRSFPYLYEWE